MVMRFGEITKLRLDECWQLLRSHDLGRIAATAAGTVKIFPLNYPVDTIPAIYFRATLERSCSNWRSATAWLSRSTVMTSTRPGASWSRGAQSASSARARWMRPNCEVSARGSRRRRTAGCASDPPTSPAADSLSTRSPRASELTTIRGSRLMTPPRKREPTWLQRSPPPPPSPRSSRLPSCSARALSSALA